MSEHRTFSFGQRSTTLVLIDVILFLVESCPGRTQAQLADAIFGRKAYQQRANPDADGDAALYQTDKRLQQKTGKSRAHGRALCPLVQLRSHPQDAADNACNGSRDRQPAMFDGGCCSAG